MKNIILIYKFILQIVILINTNNVCEAMSKSSNSNNIHIHKGFTERGEGKTREYQFYDVDERAGYFTTFPNEEIVKKFPKDLLEKWNLEYSIYTSFDDAELAMVEILDMSSLFMFNIVDLPLGKEQIGDNCWYQISVGSIKFIRNNVLVSISPKIYDSSFDTTIAQWLAKEVDTLIMKSEKVDDANLISAPEIHSVEIVSALPESWVGIVKVKVNATDQKSKQLFFRKYATGFGIISETGYLTLSLNKKADSSEVSDKAKVKIWVWNEDHVVASIEEYIPF